MRHIFYLFFFKNNPVVLQFQINHASCCVALWFMSRKIQEEAMVKIFCGNPVLSSKLCVSHKSETFSSPDSQDQFFSKISFQPPWTTFLGLVIFLHQPLQIDPFAFTTSQKFQINCIEGLYGQQSKWPPFEKRPVIGP